MYCTLADVRNALTPGGSEVSGKDQTAASLADWQIQDAMDEAEGTVKAYLSRYMIELVEVQVPVDPSADPIVLTSKNVAPAPVRWWTRNIAAWLATLTYKRNQDVPEDDPIRLRYQMTMNALREVRDGVIDLVLDPAGDAGDIFIENITPVALFDLRDMQLSLDPNPYPGVQWPYRRVI